jgi:hypothetical protein
MREFVSKVWALLANLRTGLTGPPSWFSGLRRSCGGPGSNLFLNYAVWESVAHFRAAFTHPDFKRALEKYPSSAVAAPHLFKRIAVPNLCTG